MHFAAACARSCSHYNKISIHVLQNTKEEPIRPRNDRSRSHHAQDLPFIVGCSHCTRKNTRFRALTSSPTQVPCNIHAAINYIAFLQQCVLHYTLLQLDVSSHSHLLHPQALLHTNALHTDAFRHTCLYTQALLHTNASTHTNAFTHKQMLSQIPFHTGAFTRKRF